MKKILLIAFISMLLIPAKASHIVGGEFELSHISGNTYRLSLILYFDSINGDARARDGNALVRFFRKRDNTPVLLIPGNANSGSLNLLFDGIQRSVSYTNDECQIEELVTNKLVYTAIVTLRDDVFNDPLGYYVSWERCCRNYNINNIFSAPPEAGIYAGQTFYLEFPPVVKNGQPFINNTPRLFPPLSDFACPRIPYYVDFAGVDDDGDSLAYSIVTPLNTHTNTAIPPGGLPLPGPYPEVTWQPGFGIDNIMNGLTNLEISEDGFLTVTPNLQGLFVFAVKCEEFRDGEKIGEVRRDFQMLVLDACPVPVPPEIVGKALDDPIFGADGTLEVSFDESTSDAERCFEVRVTDPSTMLPDDGNQEKVRIKAISLDFKKNISEVLPEIKSAVITNGGESIFRICLPACPYKPTGSFKIGIVAFDDACALPLTDTLVVTINLDPPPNTPPQFNNGSNGKEIVENISEGGAIRSWPIEVNDADGDLMTYQLIPVGFNLADYGMTFTGSFSGEQAGPIQKTLTWDPKCDVYDFTEKSTFELYFIVEDKDPCSIVHADTTHFQLSITDFSQITPPVINNSVIDQADSIELTMQMYGDPLVVDITGFDVDNTFILLRGNGIGFNASAYGVSFPRDFAQGSVGSQFRWELTCDTLDYESGNVFHFSMVVVDSLNKCKFYKADTLVVSVTVEPPEKNEFLPPNVFTPNGDNKNDFFAMAAYDELTDEFVSILPEDNCFGEFRSIQIYNRWGRQVYESFDRNFRWYGENMPVGVYYYSLKYTHRDYKGMVTIQF